MMVSMVDVANMVNVVINQKWWAVCGESSGRLQMR
jgi:hypothetical protein